MKKLILAAMCIATIMVSCKKENKHTATPQDAVVNETETISTGARVMPGATMEDYIKDPTDEQNERINKALYDYMLGMKKVFASNHHYLEEALTLAKTSSLKTVNLHYFICHSATCKDEFNAELCTKYPEKGLNWDHCTKLLDEMGYTTMQYGKENYEPGMHIINADKADLTQGYYLALPEEAQAADENHDYIPVWHVLKNGTTRLELINEQQALQTKEPVIIFNPIAARWYIPANQNPETYHPPVYEGPDPNARDPFIPPAIPVTNNFTNGTVYHNYVHISTHFEQYGPSQYYISYVISDGIGDAKTSSDMVHLTNVPRNYVDCWCTYSMYQSFFEADSYNNVMTFVAYEHDWWASKIPMTPGGSYQVEIRSKYSHETYQVVGNKILGSMYRYSNGVREITENSNNQVHAIDK